jgi:alkanesulfonate monooxygenase
MSTVTVSVYDVTPESEGPADAPAESFHSRMARVGRAAEEAGWTGMLVPHNLHEVDPWVVASCLGALTANLVPLVAVQAAATPPHSAAACAAAFAMLYERPIHFNLVAGARDDEMRRIGDDLSHDQRYDRVREYGRALRALLDGSVVDQAGAYYTYRKFHLTPRPSIVERCRIFVAGSSPASLAVATDIADVVVTHPAPFLEWRDSFLRPLKDSGYAGEIAIRIGVICRPTRDDAWEIARQRFPETWIAEQETLLKTQSQNVWARDLARLAVAEKAHPPAEGTYWLGAFRSGRASAPFLVGSYDDVGAALGEYLGAGVTHVLLNGAHTEDYAHTRRGIELATQGPVTRDQAAMGDQAATGDQAHSTANTDHECGPVAAAMTQSPGLSDPSSG